MWHAVAVPATPNASDPSGDVPSLGDFGSDAPGVETEQSDSLSADANFLTGMLSSLKPATGTAGEKSASRAGPSLTSGDGNPPPSILKALLVVATPPAREVGIDVELGRANLGAEPVGAEETGGESNGSGAALAIGVMVGAPAKVGFGLAPLLIELSPPSRFTPLASLGSENRRTPDSVSWEAKALDGSAADHQSAREGFLLDAREWLPMEQAPESIDISPALGATSTDPSPVAISIPVAQSPMPDQLLRSPAPTSTGRLLPPDGHGSIPYLTGIKVENTLPSALQDPLSFVVRLVEERPLLEGSSPEFPNLRDPETLAGSFSGTSDPPSLERALGRARDGSWERVGQEPGTVAQVRSMSALDFSGGGQAEGGDGQHHLLAREESALPNAIPRAGGERDLASWIAGHSAGYSAGQSAGHGSDVVGMAGSPGLNESGLGAGVTTAKLQGPTVAMPEPAPERLTAAPRELVLIIPGSSDGDGVLASVHVRDRNGAVEIAVRTPNEQLSSSLQDGLPELVARLETQGTTASASRGEQMSGGAADGGPADWSGTPDGQSQERQSHERQTGQEQHAEDRGGPRGQPGGQLRELRQQRQARWQASLGLASG